MKISSASAAAAFVVVATTTADAYAMMPSSTSSFAKGTTPASSSSTSLRMGLFDGKFGGGGSGKDRLDDEWRKQQEMLADRRKPKQERDKYFTQLEERRAEASKKQNDMWGWQTKTYNKGEDPIDEWKKRRSNGQISDLEDQYGDPKEIGGIPLPMASFGVGGEFGVGGKFDNGGRFDLRLPYAGTFAADEIRNVVFFACVCARAK